MRNATVWGAVFGVTTGLAWGGQFVIGASALHRVDAFPLTTLRYALAGVLLLGLLAWREGRQALRLEGRGLRLFGLGTLGFAGFNLLAYTGLAHARPQSASLIVALAPLVTALVLWQRTRVRPSAATFGFLAVALIGVALVISGGHPTTIVDGSIGWGDGLVLAGVISFVIYGLGATRMPELSPLRYTAQTAALGWLSIAGATVVAIAAGLVPRPSAADVWAVSPHILYLAIPGAVIGVLTWNASIRLIGPQNAVLFGNLIPVTTFAIEIVRGYRPDAVELGGAALTIAALVTSNLYARRKAPAVVRSISVEQDGLAEAA
jgi:drug/metabolite transporter (DMT)-like permease